jgi:hypothetical protein
VLNRVQPVDDPSVATNAHWVAKMTGVDVLGPGPYIADAPARPAALGDVIAPLLG